MPFCRLTDSSAELFHYIPRRIAWNVPLKVILEYGNCIGDTGTFINDSIRICIFFKFLTASDVIMIEFFENESNSERFYLRRNCCDEQVQRLGWWEEDHRILIIFGHRIS